MIDYASTSCAYPTTRIPNSCSSCLSKTVKCRYLGNRKWYHRSAGEGCERRYQAGPNFGPKGRNLEVRAHRAPRLLVIYIYGLLVIYIYKYDWSPAEVHLVKIKSKLSLFCDTLHQISFPLD